MKRIPLTITAQSPLAIGQRKPGGSVSEASDYISGTVIRGAIAKLILQHSEHSPSEGDDFHSLFLNDQAAVFQNAYPAIAKHGEDEYALSGREVYLLPATALSSKTDSGFKPRKAGVFDSLIDSFCAREHGLFYEPNDLQGDRVEPFTGFYSKQNNGTDAKGQPQFKYATHALSKRLLTRVGINRSRATAQDEILYSLEVLNEVLGKHSPVATAYQGSILMRNDSLAEQLVSFINNQDFQLGGSTSRGLGHVDIHAGEPEQVEEVETITVSELELTKRVNEFNQKLQERWDYWNAFGKPDPDPTAGRTFFTINLQSDAILTEQWRRTMVISKSMLRQFTELQPDADVELHMAYSSYDYRSGWNAAWGLPKDVELVTNMGGVFLYSVPDDQTDLWCKQLAKLELDGVCDRTTEGFGQIKVCDKFHLIFREEPV
jgi:CRISPR-associated protein Csx10